MIVFQQIEGNPKGKSITNISLSMWPIMVPEAYLTSVRNLEPFAIVILAHYGVVLHRAMPQWYIIGWGAQIA